MSALVFSPGEVRLLLPMERCIELVDDALRALARGQAENPLRWGAAFGGERAFLGTMPGFLHEPPALGMKVIAVFPGNHGTELDSHQGVVLLFDEETGVPTALLDASEVTAIRTAAASAVATRALAREDAGDLALIGSGVQARTHLEAMAAVRPLRRVRVFSPRAAMREGFAERARERYGFDVTAAGCAREAVEGADLICTVTSSAEPVVLGEWIAPGAHVNAVGSSVATARELDAAAVARARMIVDRRESAENESGEYLMARAEGALGEDHVAGELGEVLLGQVEGRRSPEEVTLFMSLGLAVEDLAVAHHVLERGRAEGVGTPVELGGHRE